MQRFIIEREIPSIGQAGPGDLRAAADKSNGVLADLGPEIQWIESYVTADKTFCVYLAADEEIIREHARRSGFPATRITPVRSIIDPTTAGR
jgi:hypothetical protein